MPSASERLLQSFQVHGLLSAFNNFSWMDRSYRCSTASLSKGAHSEAWQAWGIPLAVSFAVCAYAAACSSAYKERSAVQHCCVTLGFGGPHFTACCAAVIGATLGEQLSWMEKRAQTELHGAG